LSVDDVDNFIMSIAISVTQFPRSIFIIGIHQYKSYMGIEKSIDIGF